MIILQFCIEGGAEATNIELLVMACGQKSKRRSCFEIEEVIASKKKKKELLTSLNQICENLKAVDVERMLGEQCCEDDIVTWLVAKFSFQMVNRAVKIYNQLPLTLTSHQKQTYLNKTPVIQKIIELSEDLCPSLLTSNTCADTTAEDGEVILAPPVEQCFECDSGLSSNHAVQ